MARGQARAVRTRRAAALAVLAGVLLGTGACVPGSGSGAAGARPPLPTATTAAPGGIGDRIGVLFQDEVGGPRMCTASVVHSPHRNLLVTAAHCVRSLARGTEEDLVFAPGYRDGKTPFGTWDVLSVVTDPHWTDDEDPDYDVAFLTVDELDGRQIEDVLGANPLGTGQGVGLDVTVTGYPNTDESPIACSTRTSGQGATQERFDCAGYTDGTSGSPWLADGGRLVGVIGGYEQGGATPETSYSVLFDDRVAALYRQASA
ncbi:trypsin-like serine peptidase [Kitasatospora camelliae]|uniref:Trypsin-like peptidase domain-containing protein n=1 Tax=Kitasatospora camelliae TaxID=3156397 RepID=A0AAU8JT57_9ACTN